MGYIVDIQFFNTFILRSEPISPATTSELYVEESRIKGGFNEPFVSIGPKAHLVDETYAETRRNNALIYSGIYNSKTDINRTNVFSAAEPITRAVDPSNGSIQKLHAEDTNLNILQEDKVSYALIDKDALFTAEGGQLTASGAAVIGQIVPYLGKYGTQNPESFAFKGIRKYFVDKNRGAVLRLSRDGITEISSYGMKDYFRDNLAIISNEFNDNDKIIGAYDDHADEYIVSLQSSNITNNYNTLSFDESVNGWTSFYTYKPNFGFSLNKKFYTLQNNNLWEQYKNSSYNTFYDEAQPSTITIIANQEPSIVKNFNTINYEGTNEWQMFSSSTDLGMEAYQIKANNETISGEIVPKFVKKENKYYSQLMNKDLSNGDQQITGDTGLALNPSGLKGFFATVKMQNSNVNSNVELYSVSHNIVKSS